MEKEYSSTEISFDGISIVPCEKQNSKLSMSQTDLSKPQETPKPGYSKPFEQQNYSQPFQEKQNIKNKLKYTEYDLKCQELFNRYEYLDTVPGQSVKQIIVGLMSIAEVVFKKIPGEERMQRVLQTYELYLIEHNVKVDVFTKNVLRQFCQVLFEKYEKQLKTYYSQLFDIAVGFGRCLTKIIL